MAVTFKQLEAFYWVATLKSFADAADRLNMAQSTISKRLLELEAIIGTALFERTSREIRQTPAGASLLPVATDLLSLEHRFREIAAGPLTFRGSFRFGVTELVALTWLPRLVVAMKQAYLHLVPEPHVEASRHLFAKLEARELDLVIGLDPPGRPHFQAVPLKSVQLEWVSAPGFGPGKSPVPLEEIARYPILTQAGGSGLQHLVLDWLTANGLKLNRVVQCNSLNVLAALAAAGLGITFLTTSYFGKEIHDGYLRVIDARPTIPPIQYFAVHRIDDLNPLSSAIADIAQSCCDFSARGLRA